MDDTMMGDVLAMPGIEDTNEPETGEEGEPPFDSNLAVLIEKNDELGEKTLNTLGDDLKALIDADAESRSEWDRLAAKGLRLMGLTDEKRDEEWMSSVTHSLMAEACVRFQSQAITEIFPPGGPAKPKILAKETEEIRDQGDRVAKYINYLYTEVMPGAYEQEEKALLHIPREGAVFVRPYWDEARRRPARSMIKAADIILPYSAESLAASPRITYAYSLHENEVRRLIRTGFFRDVELDKLGNKGANDTESEIVEETDRVQGRSPGADTDTAQGDETYDFWECQAEIELPGFEFDIPLPYMVIMERQSATIMAIYRNWRDEDDTFTRRNWIVKRGFVPNLDGIYDYGLFHLIGGLAEAATGCLRSLLDAAQLSNLQAKLISGMVNLDTLDKSPLKPGEIRPIPISVDDLRKAVMDISFGEPSQTMFNLLGFLVEAGRRFASTADLMVGDASNQAPVGTTVALIEQGSKVYSAIHARLHRSFADELRIMSEIVHEYTADDALYPYAADDEPWTIRQDFDDRVDVVPVSDPKVFSQSQRIAKMQAALELSKDAPGIYDKPQAAPAHVGVAALRRHRRHPDRPGEGAGPDGRGIRGHGDAPHETGAGVSGSGARRPHPDSSDVVRGVAARGSEGSPGRVHGAYG